MIRRVIMFDKRAAGPSELESFIEKVTSHEGTYGEILKDPLVVEALSNAYDRHIRGETTIGNKVEIVNSSDYNTLKFLGRWMYLTLGFYGTSHNYREDSKITYPDGSRVLEILRDEGHRAAEAMTLVDSYKLFKGVRVQEWPCENNEDLRTFYKRMENNTNKENQL